MKYQINIEGGFTGIPKQFEGELKLDKEAEKDMLEAVSVKREDHSHLRDGFTYTVKFSDGKEVYESQFNESNLPENLRRFITDVQKGSH
ncbi:protealysin inhibitor emfourin [Zobellia uliginosa]|uniref:protealysin inhibitor emfourin n=1 Tax=Zobellia uliginosa TaxID=143224 RepID=UPI0026E4557A|nr:protealysin inhibitor emfourin [Zobellia uliginosa]MDO6517875.1 hypothetical protein [Zobellia uliginosa]